MGSRYIKSYDETGRILMAVSIDAQAAINEIAAELAVRDKETEIEETAKLESKAFWDGVKGQASAAGVSIMEWLGEVAFQGSQNPTGMVQETLGALSYPFRETAEVAFDYINPYSPGGYMHSEELPDALSFLNENQTLRTGLAKNPVIAAAPALLGGFGIPVNKWAEGEDVLKGDVVAGVASLTGPVAGLTARGVGKVAQKVAPTLTDEVVDQTRRGLLKATGVGTGLLAVPVIASKALLKKSGKVGAKVAMTASTIGRNLTTNFFGTVGTLLRQAEEGIAKGVDVVPGSGLNRIYDVAGMKLSPSTLVRMGNEEKEVMTFFKRLKLLAERDLGIGPNVPPAAARAHGPVTTGQRIGRIDPDTGLPYGGRPYKLDDETLVVDLGGAPRIRSHPDSNVTQPIPAESPSTRRWLNTRSTAETTMDRVPLPHGNLPANPNVGRSSMPTGSKGPSLIDEYDDEYWEYLRGLNQTLHTGDTTIGNIAEESVDIVNKIMRKQGRTVQRIEDDLDIYRFFRSGDERLLEHLSPTQIREVKSQYNLMGLDRDHTRHLFANLQDVKWGMAHLEYLEKTDPARLLEILTDISKVGDKASIAEKGAAKIAVDMIEALK